MARPLSPESAYARSLGLTPDQLRYLGGTKRLRDMPQEGRTILVTETKRVALRRMLRRYEVRDAPTEPDALQPATH